MAFTKHTLISNAGNYGSARTAAAIRYLVYHYTANKTDTAVNNANYFKNNIVQASAHYFVDDTTVYQSVPDLTTAWSVGGNKWSDCNATGGGTMYGKITNENSISIEMCSTNGQISEATVSNAIALGKEIMAKYNIPVSNVYRHFDVNGKHCPGWSGWYGKDSSKWTTFKSRLTQNTTATASSTVFYRVRKTWNDAASQLGAFTSLENAKAACKNGYFVFDGNGNIVYPKATATAVANKYSVGQYVTFSTSYPSPTSPCGISYATSGSGNGQITAIVNGQAKYQIDNGKRYCNDGDISGIYTPKAASASYVSPVKNTLSVNTYYRVYAGGKWYSEVKNLEDYAGDSKNSIRAIALKVDKGNVKYRIHVKGGGWYPYVTGYNINDFNNGYAGDCKKDIDAIEIYYTTPSGYISKRAKYRLAPTNGNYYSWQYDNEKTNGQDGYAGVFNKSCVKFQFVVE